MKTFRHYSSSPSHAYPPCHNSIYYMPQCFLSQFVNNLLKRPSNCTSCFNVGGKIHHTNQEKDSSILICLAIAGETMRSATCSLSKTQRDLIPSSFIAWKSLVLISKFFLFTLTPTTNFDTISKSDSSFEFVKQFLAF